MQTSLIRVAVGIRAASPETRTELQSPSFPSQAMSRLLQAASATKKLCCMALHRSLSGRLDATRLLASNATRQPCSLALGSRLFANEQRIPQQQCQRRLTVSNGFPRETAPSAAGPARGTATQSDVSSQAAGSVPTLAPELYVAANTFQKRDNLLVLDLLNTAFRRAPSEDQQFLDVGCAVGDFTRDVLLPRSSPCWRIVGTDVSSSMIAYAERFFAHPRITYDVLDLSHDVSPFVERYGRFDRVYSFFCLHWIRDQVGALRNIRNLMAPEGECLLQFCARTPVYTLWRDFALMDRWKSRISNIEDFIPPSQDADDRLSYLENILAASALRPHTCEVLRNVWTFPSEQHLAGSISAVLPVADGVPEHERQELTKAMSAEMLRRCRKGPAGFSAEFDVYVVHASRSAASRTTQ